MNDAEVLSEFTTLLRDLLGDDSIALQMDTTRSDVPGWDSFQYVNFIVGVEAMFGIKFSVSDVESFTRVGEIVSDTQRLCGH